MWTDFSLRGRAGQVSGVLGTPYLGLLAHLPHKERAGMALGAVMSKSEGVAGSSGITFKVTARFAPDP